MTKQLIPIILTISVFLSSTGILMNSHFCQEKYLGSSQFFSLGSCYSNKDETPYSIDMMSYDSEYQNDKKGCCDNKKEYYSPNKDQQVSKREFKQFEFSKKIFSVIPFTSTLVTTTFLTQYFPPNYSPHFIVFDRCAISHIYTSTNCLKYNFQQHLYSIFEKD